MCDRRALPESLRAAVAEAASLPCIMEEAEALTHTLALLQQWVETAEAALRSHEAAQLASDAQPRRQPAGGDVPAAQQPPPQPAADQAQSAAEPARPCADAVASARTVDAPTQAQPAQSAPEPAQPGDAAGQAGGHAAAAEAAQGQAAEGDDGGIELGTSEALDALLSHDVGPDLDAMEAAMKRAPPQPAAAPPPMAAALAGVRGSLSIKTLSQLVKSALSMEVEVGDLQERLLTALKQQRWRIRVEAALKPNSKYTGSPVCRASQMTNVSGRLMQQCQEAVVARPQWHRSDALAGCFCSRRAEQACEGGRGHGPVFGAGQHEPPSADAHEALPRLARPSAGRRPASIGEPHHPLCTATQPQPDQQSGI